MAPVPEGKDRPSSERRRRRVGGRRRPKFTQERAGLVSLCLALALPALGFGGQRVPVLLGSALFAATAAFFLGGRLGRMPKLAWFALIITAYTAFQLLPLPAALLRVISPASASVWSQVLKPFGEESLAFGTLSVDPSATAIELLKAAMITCVVIAACGAMAVRGASFLVSLVFGCSLGVATITLLHGLFDLHRIYGLYAPPDLAERWTRGPFVNGNNLSGFLNLGIFAGAGLWLAARGGVPRWLLGLGIPLMVVGVVLSGSRAGIAALLVGTVAFLFLAARSPERPVLPLLGGVVLLGGLAVVGLLSLGDARLRQGLADTSIGGKVTGWRWTLDLIRDFPVFGVGRGAFETAFPPYRGAFEHDWSAYFAHAENFLIDWTAQWGIPFTLFVVVLGAFFVKRASRRIGTDPRVAGSWVGLGALCLQNLADFGFEIYAIAAASALAFATGAPRDDSGSGRLPRQLWLPIGAVALSLLVVLGLGANPARVDRRRLADRFQNLTAADANRRNELRTELRSAMLRHPGEPYFPMLGAFLAERERRDPLPWLARALERGPRYGGVHLALATAMHERKKTGQALMHLRLAARYDVNVRDVALSRAVRWAGSVRHLIAGFPEGSEGGSLFPKLCELLAAPARTACFREAVRRTPHAAPVLKELVEGLLAGIETNSGGCTAPERVACEQELERVLSAYAAAAPRSFRSAYYQARLQAARGDVGGAAKSLLANCPAAEEAEDCLDRAVEYSSRAGDINSLGTALDRQVALRCLVPARCADAHDRASDLFGERQAWARSLRHLNAAAEADPTSSRWLKVAETATRIGAPSSARMALQRASLLGTNAPDERRRVDELEQRLRDEPLLR
jgi:O-antigen ligase